MTSEKSKSTSVTPISDLRPNLEEAIRRRAYELYEQRGCKDGHDTDHLDHLLCFSLTAGSSSTLLGTAPPLGRKSYLFVKRGDRRLNRKCGCGFCDVSSSRECVLPRRPQHRISKRCYKEMYEEIGSMLPMRKES
jgi:hypothetical protein